MSWRTEMAEKTKKSSTTKKLKKIDNKIYEQELFRLQLELVKLWMPKYLRLSESCPESRFGWGHARCERKRSGNTCPKGNGR